VAVPRSLAAIALAHGQRGRVRLGALARAGQTIAEGLGAKRRAAVLRTVGEVAALSLRGRDVSRAFLAAGGVVAGGIVTEQDLEAPQPAEADAVVTRLAGDASAITVPWAPPPERARGGDAIVAVDGRGVVAALGFCGPRDHEAISLPDLECTVAGDAVPVRRGVTRVAPGTVLPASAAIAVISMSGGFMGALGAPGCFAIGPDELAVVPGAPAIDEGLAMLRGRLGASLVVAAVRDARDARALVMKA
jgi:gamma-glutamyltranspeptidase/glutathione hydrolase